MQEPRIAASTKQPQLHTISRIATHKILEKKYNLPKMVVVSV